MRRFEHRYWDGSEWTANVASAGRQAVDEMAPVPAPTAAASGAMAPDTAATAVTPAEPTSDVWAPVATVPTTVPTVPLKLCPHCQTQTATASTACPNCGKRYVKKKKWPWVLAAVFLLMVIGFAGCVALVGTAAKTVVDELNAEQARHAITPSQFAAVSLGSSRADVINQLGKQPEDAQQFVQRGIVDGQDINSSCIYYNKAGGSFGDRYQFCFQNDALQSKNAY